MWAFVMSLAMAQEPVVRHRVMPSFPHHADEPIARCTVRVQIDARGRPTEAASFGCPEPFASAASDAVRRWRWELEGVPARDLVVVTMRRADGPRTIAPPDRCDHQLAVGRDGSLSPTEPHPLDPCVGLFPDAVPPPPVPLSCAVGVQVVEGERTVDAAQCSPEAQEWIEALLERVKLSRAGAHVLHIHAESQG